MINRKLLTHRPKKGKNTLKLLLLGVLVAIMALEVIAVVAIRQSRGPLPPLVGNFPENRAILEEAATKEQFSFAVFGDTEGATGSFDLLTAKLRRLPVDFAIHLGDAYAQTYPYFRAELRDDLRLPFPLFLVPGNQDLRDFSVKQFEEAFGPSLFSFTYQECLFIGLNISGGQENTAASLTFLKDTLNQKGSMARKIFVFMHVPPAILPGHKFAAPAKLTKMFAAHQVDYVFSGHYHGYTQVQKKNTTYIVTGAGGKDLEENSPYGQFHHGVVMTVGPDFVSETIVPLPKTYDLESKLQRFAIVEVYPWLQENRGSAVVGNLLVLLLILQTLRSLLRRSR